MGGPAKRGYSGGKLSPYEKDLIRGIVAAKSLQTFEAICKFPWESTLKVFHIKKEEKTRRIKRKDSSRTLVFLINFVRFITHQKYIKKGHFYNTPKVYQERPLLVYELQC